MRRMASIRKYIDIGANLTDEMYQGSYHGSKKHEPDLEKVLNRTWAGGIDKLIITGGSLLDSKKSLELSHTDSRLFSTVGCHPTRCSDFLSDPDNYLNGLRRLILDNSDKVVAIGECGLDYDRLHFCEKEVQIKYFEFQLHLSSEFQLPLFLHCRGAANDLLKILNRNKHHIHGGVVHSFDGTHEELDNILKLDLYIGINGCSLRTKENLEVAARIPQDRLMIETDSPWCEVKSTHPGYQHIVTKYSSVKKDKYSVDSNDQVKGRNEPVNIVQVLEILAAIRNENIDQLAEAIYNNTCKLFFNNRFKKISLRTKENLEVAARIPQDRLMIETDSPWCEVKSTHPGYQHIVTKYSSVKKDKYSVDSDYQVKGRNEPVNIVQVLEILAAIRNENIDQLAEAIYNNTCKLFFNNRFKKM